MPPYPNRLAGESIIDYAERTGALDSTRPIPEAEFEAVIERLLEAEEMGQIIVEEPEHPLVDTTLDTATRTLHEIQVPRITANHRGNPFISWNMAASPQMVSVEPQAPTEKKLDAKTIDKLELARVILYKREQERLQRIPKERMGRREAEYQRLLRNKKEQSLTALEIVHSEVPINLGELPGNKYEEILKLGYCPGFFQTKKNKDDEYLTTMFVCKQCNLSIEHPEYSYICMGALYCAEHVPEFNLCVACNALKEGCTKITTFDDREVMACNQCIKGRSRCERCPARIGSEYIEHRLCQSCLESAHDHEIPYRHFSLGLKWVSKDKGKIYQSYRMFSCELEAMSPIKDFALHLHKTLPKEMGIGQDGSVGVRGESPWGFEVQTPRLLGKKGEELIERAVSGVKGVKAILDETCGMHIHLDGKGIVKTDRSAYPVALIQLIKSYVVFEDVIMSFLPYSRRGNDFCRPLASSIQLAELDTLETVQDVEKFWYKERTGYDIREAKRHHYHSSRYFGANFHSLLAHGHFEVRFHSGTLNAKKILEWANLHALILDACVREEITKDFIEEYLHTSRLSERTELLFKKIGLSESSKQYFMSRQKKFGDKKNDEDEVKQSGRTNNVRPEQLTSLNQNRPRGFVVQSDNGQSRMIVADEVTSGSSATLTLERMRRILEQGDTF